MHPTYLFKLKDVQLWSFCPRLQLKAPFAGAVESHKIRRQKVHCIIKTLNEKC